MIKKKQKVIWSLFKIFLSTGIIAGIIYYKQDDLTKAVRNINYLWILPAILFYVILLISSAWRWYLLLQVQKINLSFWETFSLTMQGAFFSLVLPGSIGGDFVKAGIAAKKSLAGKKLKCVFTILIDRIIGLTALFIFVGIAGGVSIGFLKDISGGLELLLYVLIFACSLGIALAMLLFFHRRLENIRLFSWFIKTADKYSKGGVLAIIESIDDFKDQYKIIFFCIIISIILVHLNLALIIFFIALATGVNDIPFKIFVLASSIGNTVGALPVFPAGLGARDLVVQNILAAGGIKEQSALIPLIFSCLFITINAFGGFFFIFSNKSKISDISQYE